MYVHQFVTTREGRISTYGICVAYIQYMCTLRDFFRVPATSVVCCQDIQYGTGHHVETLHRLLNFVATVLLVPF